MFKEIIDGLINILGPIATLSKDRRELKDSALRAISNALDETYLYYRDLERINRNLDREELIAKYWSGAAILIRHFDSDLAQICDRKSEYWINPERYNPERIEELSIALDDVRQAYRKMLKPSYGIQRSTSSKKLND